MARALLGYVGNSADQALIIEVARLRKRVAELESEVSALRAPARDEFDLELHHIAQAAAPVLT